MDDVRRDTLRAVWENDSRLHVLSSSIRILEQVRQLCDCLEWLIFVRWLFGRPGSRAEYASLKAAKELPGCDLHV